MYARRHQMGGAMVMLVAQICFLLIALTWAGMLIGRWANQRSEQQNQSDAISIAAMEIARKQGTDNVCQHPAMQALMRGNSRSAAVIEDCGRFVEVVNPDGSTSLQFQANIAGAVDNFEVPFVEGFEAANFTMRTRGTAAVKQEKFDDAEERRPKFVLVLDYSGSMGPDFPRLADGRVRIDALRDSVNILMDMQLKVDYGLVMYESNVVRTIAPGPNNEAAIRQAINSREPNGSTNYEAAIRSARQLLAAAEDTGYYMLFMSDGQPTAGGDPLPEADRARNAGMTIFTLNIGGGAAQAALLLDMGGTSDPPEAYAHSDYYFAVTNQQEFIDTFRCISASIVCGVGPLRAQNLRPDSEIFVLLRDPATREETPIPFLRQLNPDDGNQCGAAGNNDLGWNYDIAENKVRLTEAACERVLDDNMEILVRYGDLNLVQ